MGEKRLKIWKFVPLSIFWMIWKERNRIAVRDGTSVVQRLKHSFVSNLWSRNSLYIGEELSSLVCFLEWVASN